jgi:hypothetical protein
LWLDDVVVAEVFNEVCLPVTEGFVAAREAGAAAARSMLSSAVTSATLEAAVVAAAGFDAEYPLSFFSGFSAVASAGKK